MKRVFQAAGLGTAFYTGYIAYKYRPRWTQDIEWHTKYVSQRVMLKSNAISKLNGYRGEKTLLLLESRRRFTHLAEAL